MECWRASPRPAVAMPLPSPSERSRLYKVALLNAWRPLLLLEWVPFEWAFLLLLAEWAAAPSQPFDLVGVGAF